MQTLDQHRSHSTRKASPQESLKIVLKALVETGQSLLTSLVKDSHTVPARKGKLLGKGGPAPAHPANPQEVADAVLNAVANALADLSSPQSALQRALLNATLAELSLSALQVKGKTALMASASDDDEELTTEEAAKLLFVSRPYMVKLLDSNEIPMAKVTVGGQRRVRKADVLSYKARLRTRQEKAMDKLVSESEKLGLYKARSARPRIQRR
jgi:excisionase family DNA binding protein